MKKINKITTLVVVSALTLLFYQEVQSTATAAGETGIKAAAKFSGTAPAAQDLKKTSDPFCAKTQTKDMTVVVNGNGTLKNVVWRVVKGATAAAGASPAEITVNQNGCVYEPRVVAALVNQSVRISSSDMTLHNVHIYKDKATVANKAVMAQSKGFTQSFKEPGVHKMKCDVHPWMTGWVVVNDNPFFCVTGDTGECTIQGLTPGAYTLEAWHEKYGTKTVDVTVADGQTAGVETAFSAQ